MSRPRMHGYRAGRCRHCEMPFVWRQRWRTQRARVFCSPNCWSAYHTLRQQRMPLDEIVRRYRAGESTIQIARAGGYRARDGGSLGRRLKAAGVTMRPAHRPRGGGAHGV